MTISDIDSFLAYYGNLRARTLKVAQLIPAERIDECLTAHSFSPAELMRHLAAIERQMYVPSVLGQQPYYQGQGPELGRTKNEILAFMHSTHAESLALLGTLTPEQLNGKCLTPAGTPITVWKWLRAMSEHEIHHRGQLYTYLAWFGVSAPPLFGLTAEQVAERGRAAQMG